jgi:hypothetical protein
MSLEVGPVVVFWVCWDWIGGGVEGLLEFMMGMCGWKGLLSAVVFGSAGRWLFCEVGMLSDCFWLL